MSKAQVSSIIQEVASQGGSSITTSMVMGEVVSSSTDVSFTQTSMVIGEVINESSIASHVQTSVLVIEVLSSVSRRSQRLLPVHNRRF